MSQTPQDGQDSTPTEPTESPTGSEVSGATPLGPELIATMSGAFGATGSGDTSGFGGLVTKVMTPAPATRPYGGYFDAVSDELEAALNEGGVPATEIIERVTIEFDEITYHVRREHLPTFAQALRDEPGLRFEWCAGVSGVHYPEFAGKELHACYHFLSITHNRRVRVEVSCPDDDPHIPSIVSIYPTNDWHERETFDFFGIIFDGHPALTRIEMPDDWSGHPQRKDYSLNGIPVEYKGATTPSPDHRRSYQ